MPVSESTEFWPFLDQVMHYAVDKTDTYPLTCGARRVGEIKQQTFLTSLYVRRDDGRYERRLAQLLLSSSRLLVMASPRGSGKTSAIYYARHLIESDPDNQKTAVILIDFRRLYDRHEWQRLTSVEIAPVYRKLLEQEVRPCFFKEAADTRDYLAWVLAGGPDETDDFEALLVNDVLDIATRVQAEAQAHRAQRASRRRTLRQWFDDNNPDYVRILREVQPRLRLAHVVTAACAIHGLDKVILVYDNVDAIPLEHQRTFVEVADNAQAAMGRIGTTCIAIRTETLPGQAIPAESRGGSTIDLTLPNERQYPTTLLPAPGLPFVTTVLDQRHRFASDLWRHISPEYSLTDASALVHKIVMREFRDSAIHRLSNESIRGVFGIYRGFGEYLDNLRQSYDIDSLIDRREGHAHTLFYLWLGVHGRRFGIVLYDILKVDPGEADHPFHELASEHYFLLTALANLTREGEHRLEGIPFPRWSQLVRRMAELGFTYQQVLGAVDVMCTKRNEDTRSVGFYDSEPDLAQLTPDSPNRIKLSLLGHTLVYNLLSKVGFVWRSAHEHGRGAPGSAGEAYLDLTPARRIRTIVMYVRHLARVHLALLNKLRIDWQPGFGNDWLNAFRRMFGIDRQLELERILLDAAKFYHDYFDSIQLENQFNVLGKLYGDSLWLVEQRQPYEGQLTVGFRQVEVTIDEMAKRERRERGSGTGDTPGADQGAIETPPPRDLP